jgi:hypothetical protein
MGGGIIILSKKGLSLFGNCLFLGVRDSRQNEKKRKKGRARKKIGGNEWTGPPNLDVPVFMELPLGFDAPDSQN